MCIINVYSNLKLGECSAFTFIWDVMAITLVPLFGVSLLFFLLMHSKFCTYYLKLLSFLIRFLLGSIKMITYIEQL